MLLRTLAAGAALTLIAACGGGDDDASDSTSSSTSTAPAPDADDTADDTVSDDTDDTVPDTVADDTAAAPESSSEWCGLAVDLDELGELSDAMLAADQAAIESYFASAVPLMETAPGLAPDEIADEVDVSAEVFIELDDLLAANDYDVLSTDLSALDERMTENLAASQMIEQYNEEHCGIATDGLDEATGGDASDFSLGEGSIRDQFIDQLVGVGFTNDEAECVFENVDFADAESFDDPTAMMDVFGTCDIDIARLAELGAGGLGGTAPELDGDGGTVGGTEPELDGDGTTVDDAAADMLAGLGLSDEQVTCLMDAIGDPSELSDPSGIFDAASECDIDLTDLP